MNVTVWWDVHSKSTSLSKAARWHLHNLLKQLQRIEGCFCATSGIPSASKELPKHSCQLNHLEAVLSPHSLLCRAR